MIEETPIEDGERMKALLADPLFQKAVTKVREKHFSEFQAAATHGASVGAWSRGRALNDLLAEMQAVVGNGIVASDEARRTSRKSK